VAKTSSKTKAPTKHKGSHSKSKRSRSIIFDTITLEGGVVSSVMLARVAAREAPAQSDADYGVPKGLTIRDEIARYFRIGAALFKDFAASPAPSAAASISFMEGLLGQVLGFTDLEMRKEQGTLDFTGGKSSLPAAPPLAASLRAVRTLPEDSTSDIAEKKRRLAAAKSERRRWGWRVAADLYIAAFVLPKKDAPREPGAALVPTTDHVWRTLSGAQVYGPLVGAAQEVTDKARVFHWPLEFPDVMSAGGFDAVIGNPPWERVELQEQEFFSARESGIALAPTAAARSTMITALKDKPNDSRERVLYDEFQTAKRLLGTSGRRCKSSKGRPIKRLRLSLAHWNPWRQPAF
jgi:hypothetical protein